MKSITIRDIDKALNISPSTVSSCLNGNEISDTIYRSRHFHPQINSVKLGWTKPDGFIESK